MIKNKNNIYVYDQIYILTQSFISIYLYIIPFFFFFYNSFKNAIINDYYCIIYIYN